MNITMHETTYGKHIYRLLGIIAITMTCNNDFPNLVDNLPSTMLPLFRIVRIQVTMNAIKYNGTG